MISEPSFPELTDKLRWNLLQKRIQEIHAVQAFSLFRSKGIEPILVKGLAAGRYYPVDEPRGSIDLDLAVAASDFDAAYELASSDAAKGLAIDLHRELRHLDSVHWTDLFSNSREIQLDGGSIRVLRPEDHLRVLCVHWLTDGGSNKARLWDIYYAVANREADFDWDRFLNCVSPLRRRWLVCTLGLASRYLDLDLSDTPLAVEAKDLPDWLIQTVEKEWSAKVKFQPLETAVFSLKDFLRQIPKRLRPNPVWATVQAEGSFDARTRVFYQIANIFRRIMPSYRRVTSMMAARGK